MIILSEDEIHRTYVLVITESFTRTLSHSFYWFYFIFYWDIVDSQCWVSFRYTAKWTSHPYTYPLFTIVFSHADHHRVLSRVPCAQQVLISYLFYTCVCSVMYGCESWTIKKAEHRPTDAFEPVVLKKTLERPLDRKEIQPVHPKGDQS